MFANGEAMVKRSAMEGGMLSYDESGDFVGYEDYAKLADLCGRMVDLLGDLKIKLNARAGRGEGD